MNTKIDWAKKLTSRKFWIAVVGFVTGLVIVICGREDIANQIGALVLSAASIVSYIIGEGLSDASYNQSNTTNKNVTITSYVDGSEDVKAVEDIETLGEVAGISRHSTRIVPDTTGRDGITIDGNEEEIFE